MLALAVVIVGLIFLTRRFPAQPSGSVTTQPASSNKQGASSERTPIDPAAFSAGACVAFAPTAGNRHLVVFLDAGHGGIDPGALGITVTGQVIHEADETLAVQLDAMALLRNAGFEVVVSRTTSTSVERLAPADVSDGVLTVQGGHDDVAARDVCANDSHAKLLLGIYFDAGASASNAGCVTGYDAVRPFAAANLRFAGLLQQDVLAAMNAQGWAIPNDGVVPDHYLGSALSSQAVSYAHLLLLGPAQAGYFTTPSQMPGALIEPLFITDPFEGSIASNARDQQVIAGGMVSAIEQYFVPAANDSATPTPTTR